MFLAGERDGLNLLTKPDREAMTGELLDLRSFVMLSGVGHWPQLEAAEATSMELLSFLADL